MNGYQLVVLLGSLLFAALSIGAVVVVIRSPVLRHKPWWVTGSLFGFAGFGIDWTVPSNVFIEFGARIPVVMIFMPFASGHVIVKSMFPVVAVIALIKAGSSSRHQA